MKLLLTTLALSAVILLTGCAEKAVVSKPVASAELSADTFDGARAFSELEAIVGLGLRDSGTPGAKRAAEHIHARLQEQGVKATIDDFESPSPKGNIVFRNVIGRIPGRGEGVIILGSHYDTKSGMPEGFQGANDSGSSTAVLIELARVLSAGPTPAPDIMLAFFDGEECMDRYGRNDGLHGSKHLVEQLRDEGALGEVKAMILLDMIGDKDLSVTIPRNSSPELVAATFAAAEDEGVRTDFSLYPFEVGDDHTPFLAEGIPAIDIIDFHFGSAPGKNDYWHTADDRIENTSQDSLETVGRITIRLLNSLLAQPN